MNLFLAELLKDWRYNNKKTQDMLARMIGIAASAVSQWEQGTVTNKKHIPKLAAVLGVDIDELCRALNIEIGMTETLVKKKASKSSVKKIKKELESLKALVTRFLLAEIDKESFRNSFIVKFKMEENIAEKA